MFSLSVIRLGKLIDYAREYKLRKNKPQVYAKLFPYVNSKSYIRYTHQGDIEITFLILYSSKRPPMRLPVGPYNYLDTRNFMVGCYYESQTRP